MRKKRCGIILAVSLLSIFLASCGNSDYIAMEESQQTEETTTSFKPKEQLLYKIVEKSDYSEGLAWIGGNMTEEGAYEYFCINTEQNPVITSFEGESLKSMPGNFRKGYTYYEKDDFHIHFMDTNGDCTGEIESEYPIKVFGAGEGIYIIVQNIDTFDTVEKKIGIVDYTGKWLMEFNSENGLSEALQEENLYNEKEGFTDRHLTYAEEGMFYMYTHGASRMLFYNSETNKTFELEKIEPLYHQKFINGHILLQSEKTYELADLNKVEKDGTITLLAADIPKTLCCDDMYYREGKFYDSNGEEVIDISQYSVAYDVVNVYKAPLFSNGYIQLIASGADGDPYWILLNEAGERVIEPVPASKSIFKLQEVSEGYVAVCTKEKWKYFDIKNKKFVDVEGITEPHSFFKTTNLHEFNGGIARILQDVYDDGYYINKRGEILLDDEILIDKDI